MSTRKVFAILALATVALASFGCHGTGRRSASAVEDPAIAGLDAEDKAFLAAPGDRGVTVVDRHPILYTPRDYWDNAGDNRFVKAAAATFVGVPVGIVGEVRQIFVGRPATVVAPATDIDYDY
jgi:photosystem II stability/assembly factor-like uncharacterized protein